MSVQDPGATVLYLIIMVSAVFIFITSVNLIEEGRDSFIGKWFYFIPSQIRKRHYFTKSEVRNFNTLFQCTSSLCERYSRGYQLDIIEDSLGSIRCPHCEKIHEIPREYAINFSTYSTPFFLEISSSRYKPWMDEMIDAPKKNRQQLRELFQDIDRLKSIRQEVEDIDQYQKYTEKERSNWTENILKGYKK